MASARTSEWYMLRSGKNYQNNPEPPPINSPTLDGPQLPILPVPLPELVPEFGSAPELIFMADGGATSRATQPPMPHAASTFSGEKTKILKTGPKSLKGWLVLIIGHRIGMPQSCQLAEERCLYYSDFIRN